VQQKAIRQETGQSENVGFKNQPHEKRFSVMQTLSEAREKKLMKILFFRKKSFL
jgi:hypothetical protein